MGLGVGGRSHVADARVAQALLATNRVHTTGRLDEVPLTQALGGASGMVFVPWFEGFGIPLVEAMAAGVPVVASHVTSLPEVGGDAVCAWVDPGNPVAISEAVSYTHLTLPTILLV